MYALFMALSTHESRERKIKTKMLTHC